jgi:hypothetical protein
MSDDQMAELLKNSLEALRKVEGKLDNLPCTEHMARLIKVEEALQRLVQILEKNGQGGIVTTVQLIKQRLSYIEEWRGKVLNEQQRAKERLEYVTLRNRWQLLFVVLSPAVAALLTWILTR